MSDEKLIVTKSKLDALATSISNKSGVATPLTIAQMKAAVDGIFTGNVTQDADGYLVLDKGKNVEKGQLRYSIDDIVNNAAPVDNVYLPTATLIKDDAFNNNTNIISIDAPNVTRLGQHAFSGCASLKTVNLPMLEYCGMRHSNSNSIAGENIVNTTSCYSFAWCHSLKTVNLPQLKKAGQGIFYQINMYSSTYQTIVVLPSISILGNMAFRQSKFKAVDLGPNLTKLWNDAFYATTCDVVILRSPTVVEAATRDAVRYIKTLYVPSAIVADYATATNWTTDASARTVLPIEGSIYETQYADGTAINN